MWLLHILKMADIFQDGRRVFCFALIRTPGSHFSIRYSNVVGHGITAFQIPLVWYIEQPYVISVYFENGGYFPKWPTCILFSFNSHPWITLFDEVVLQQCCRAYKLDPIYK